MRVGDVYKSKSTGRYWVVCVVGKKRCFMVSVDGGVIHKSGFIVDCVIHTMDKIE